jgi:hypothetical protein
MGHSVWIHPTGDEISPDKRIYTLATNDENGAYFGIYLDFTLMNAPTGSFETVHGHFSVQLQPYATTFNVNVSANAGAYEPTDLQTLVWDAASPQWNKATWEANSMTFAYNTVPYNDPFGDKTLVNKGVFVDPRNASNNFELGVKDFLDSKYTAYLGTSDHPSLGARMVVTANDDDTPPTQSSMRSTDAVDTVFPMKAVFQFDMLGMTFTGAYQVPKTGEVYAVSGEYAQPPMLAQSSAVEPNKGLSHAPTAQAKPAAKLFRSSVKPIPVAFAGAGMPVPMPINGLLNNDTMVPFPDSPTQYTDAILQQANEDFHNIICYHMENDIHKTFVSTTPTQLDSSVLAIATDSASNKSFYQSLQVPYVTSSLGRSTLDAGKQCNSLRAEAKLKTLPANSDIYKRHSDALYRMRYLQHFKGVQAYLDEQAGKTGKNFTENMRSGADAMKARIITRSAGANGMDPVTAKKNLDAALADIDSLHAWAVNKKLFYAFYLYYWCTTAYLPSLYAQFADGGSSAALSRNIKKLSLMFGILENSQQNPNGKSFQEAFNNLLMIFEMQAIIPQFVDARGNSEDCDSIMKAMLQQFYDTNVNSPDTNLINGAMIARNLATNDVIRKGFFTNFVISMRTAGSLGDWANVNNTFNRLNGASAWYQKLKNAAGHAAEFMRTICVVLLMLPMLAKYGGWSGMTRDQKIAWTTTTTSLSIALAIQVTTGIFRLKAFWSDIGGFGDAIKAFAGMGSLIAEVPIAASIVS